MSFWKNDNFFVGVTVGLILTGVTVLLLVIIVPLIYQFAGLSNPSVKILLLSVVPAIVLMRYYMRKLQFNRSGSGMLTVVFISIILYFAFIASKMDQFPSFTY
ncbi:MAG TPA: hypothetical protein VK212_00150 [Lentimicrobium sp.]|nr:hypothetical protein [Lentimicrobium sp.]